MSGYFETHLTVQAEGGQHQTLQDWAANHDLKFTHIVLSRGATPSQPMFTFHGDGRLDDQLKKAGRLAEELLQLGAVVNRIKVEVGLSHPLVPASEDQITSLGEHNYFEFHIKLLLDANDDLSQLSRLADRHAAHLSKNAFRQRSDGYQERFLTQRSYRVGRAGAVRRFETLNTSLTGAKYEILEVEREFVVFDDNLDIDRGWMLEGDSQ